MHRLVSLLAAAFVLVLAPVAQADVLYNFLLNTDDPAVPTGDGSVLLNVLPPTLINDNPMYPQFTTYYQAADGATQYVLEAVTFHIDGYTFDLNDPSAQGSYARFVGPTPPGDLYYNAITFQNPSFPYGSVVKGFYINGDNFDFESAALDVSTYGTIAWTNYEIVPSAATPEPSTLALLSTGALGMVGAFRRRFA